MGIYCSSHPLGNTRPHLFAGNEILSHILIIPLNPARAVILMVSHVRKGRIHAPGILQMMMVIVYECDACTDTDEDDYGYGDPGFPDSNCMKTSPMKDCNENDRGDVCKCYAIYEDDSFIDGDNLNLFNNEYGRIECP